MKILGMRTILGPNVFHSLPVLVMKVDLKEWADVGSHQLSGFKENLVQALPGLQQHTCSVGEVGGFIQRLERGTYMAHIIEHVAIELAGMAGMDISYGKTNYAGSTGVYDIVVRFVNEEPMKVCLSSAVDLVQSLLENREYDVASKVKEIKKLHCETRLGPSGQCLMEAARKRNIPCRPVGFGSLLQLGYGKYRRRVQAAVSDQTSLIATEIVQDKNFTKQLLADASVPVPYGFVVSNEEELLRVTENVSGPFALKPVDGHHGQGVSLNLKNREELFKAYYIAREFCSSVMVEEMCPGRDYRVLVVGGKFTAAAERFCPQVQGDGKSTIKELVEKLNTDPKRGEGHESVLTKISIDETVLETLKRQGLSLDFVAEEGRSIVLRENANLSSGGIARDVTDQVHPEIRALCERISRIVDLDICGIDIISQDLATPLNSSFKVIEVNAGPGLRMHLAPTEGTARKVGEDIINMLYPVGTPSRIPIVAVTGTNGKTTVVRLIHKILSSDSVVGLTTSDGVFIGNEKVASGDTTGPISAQIVLSDPSVEKAVLEVARGGILRRGLAYDWSDVGIVTNVREDHIGQDGIEDIEDLVWIKSLVAERVKEGGTIVLNADDEQSSRLRISPRIKKIPRKIFLYTLNPLNEVFQEHMKAGGDGAWQDDGWLFFRMQGKLHRLISIRNLRFALEGRAQFQVSNALAAVAACAAVGATPDQIMMGLMSFQSTTENRGRLNIYRIGGGYVIMDYGHNPDAISAMGELVSSFKGYKKTAVFGLPGDRADEILEASAEAVARYFDKLVVRDDLDLRGRQVGEVPELVEAVVKEKYPKVICEKIVDERVAVENVLDHIQANEIVLVLYDSFEVAMPLIRQYDPVPVSMIPELESQRVHEELSAPYVESPTHHGVNP
jgi:cyanophycin synthetase